MKRALAMGGAVITTALLASGCGSAPISGQITDKQHRPAASTTVLVTCGKSLCPITSYIPECYEIEVTSTDRTKSLCLEAKEWEPLRVGVHYTEPQNP